MTPTLSSKSTVQVRRLDLPTPCRQAGQSLIEALVGLIALIPLLLGLIWLARLIDLQQATVSAAREAAFECTVLPRGCPAGQGPNPMSLQAFSRDSIVMWHDGHRRSAFSDSDRVELTWETLNFNAPLAFAGGTAAQSIPGAVNLLTRLAGPDRFGLSLGAGLARARVSAPVPGSPFDGRVPHALFKNADGEALRVHAQLAILSDDWMARAPEGSSPDTVRNRIEAGLRVPVVDQALRSGWWPVRGLLQVAAWVGLESSANQFNPYFIDVDLVPPDRLGLSPWPLPLAPPADPPAFDPGLGAGIQDGA
jgi:hypothetical protein